MLSEMPTQIGVTALFSGEVSRCCGCCCCCSGSGVKCKRFFLSVLVGVLNSYDRGVGAALSTVPER